MVGTWLTIPLSIRYALLAVLGMGLAALANHVIYSFAYFNPRPISPWSSRSRWVNSDKSVSKLLQWPKEWSGKWWEDRSWADRIPVLGWFRLRRESRIHGTGFWVRPMLIEFAMAVSIPLLYYFETIAGGLLPEAARVPVVLTAFTPTANIVFFAHAILIGLMVAATFIDFDERTIPDVITIPGTIIGLSLGAFSHQIYMPSSLPPAAAFAGYYPTTFDSPWYQRPGFGLSSTGAIAGLAIWTVWCFALADRRWSWAVARRRGIERAVRHFLNGVFRYGFWKVLAAIWMVGVIAICVVSNIGGTAWEGLFTALVGLMVGGGVVWSIRIIASWAMNVEAMGFGDVTLMAMVGAFIGWQGAAVAFFLAPFAAIAIVLTQYMITRDTHVPFGPYLCAGTVLTIVFWDSIYNGWLAPNLFLMGGMLIWFSISMLAFLGVILFVWRQIKIRVLFRDH